MHADAVGLVTLQTAHADSQVYTMAICGSYDPVSPDHMSFGSSTLEITRTSVDEDDCNGNDSPDGRDIEVGVSRDDNGNGVPDECERVDIVPGACPNHAKIEAHERVQVAIVGSKYMDAGQVDIESVTLTRDDGVGGAVTPVARPHAVYSKLRDVATPFEGEPCGCHTCGHDGIPDLLLQFSAVEMAETLQLDSLPPDTPVSLVVSWMLLDGTPRAGRDCVLIKEGPSTSRFLSGSRKGGGP
jgi:hypothetical protein